MLITERNYLKILQGAEATINQVLRFLQNNKKSTARNVFKIRNDLRNVIIDQTRQDRKDNIQKIRDEEQKKIEERQKKQREALQRRLRQSDD